MPNRYLLLEVDMNSQPLNWHSNIIHPFTITTNIEENIETLNTC